MWPGCGRNRTDGLVAGQHKEHTGRCFAWHLIATCHNHCPGVFQCSSVRAYEGERTTMNAFLYREAIGSELEFESLTCQVQTGFHYFGFCLFLLAHSDNQRPSASHSLLRQVLARLWCHLPSASFCQMKRQILEVCFPTPKDCDRLLPNELVASR